MPEARKIFRIEETAASRDKPQDSGAATANLADVMRELVALRALLAGGPTRLPPDSGDSQREELARLKSELRAVRSTIGGSQPTAPASGPQPPAPRIIGELDAVIAGSEQAAQKILAAAEDIDQAANSLSAALKGDTEQGLAQDIRDRIIAIFEACNYQDLSSQRVAKVITTLGRIERQIARALNETPYADAAPPARGPRLPHDRGHVSQDDVDAMFAAEAKSA
jgi:chemotaxis protein CheZ